MLTRTITGLLVTLTVLCLSSEGTIAAPVSRPNEAAAQAAFDAGQYRKAGVQYQRLLRERPNDVGYRMKLAESYEIRGKQDRAAEHAEEVLRTEKRNIDALLMMARINGRMQDWEAARLYYKRAIAVDKSNSAAYLGFGQALMELGDEGAADAAFAKYLQLDMAGSN